jgi:hypothetical protein
VDYAGFSEIGNGRADDVEPRLKPLAYTGYGMAQKARAIPEVATGIVIERPKEDMCQIID